MLSSPAGEFVSELQTTEIPEGIMKHGVYLYSVLRPTYWCLYLEINCDN
jgi:hypothetical protein